MEQALVTADVVIFMLDAKAGVTPLDDFFAKWLRRKLGLLDKEAMEKELLEQRNTAAISAIISEKNSVPGRIVAKKNKKEIIVVTNKSEGMLFVTFRSQVDHWMSNIWGLYYRIAILHLFFLNSYFYLTGAHLAPKILDSIAEALRMGLGDPVPLSASHG